MKRITHDTWSTLIGVVYLGLMTNLLMVVGCLPFVVLLITTDPAMSWPLLALTAPLGAPAVAAACTTFRENARGDNQVVRVFLQAWRETWRHAMLLGAIVVGALVVLIVDLRVIADTAAAVVGVPVLVVLSAAALIVGLLGLVAISEAPTARLRDVLKASLYLGLRRWYFSALSFTVLGLQFALFTTMPAFALGLTAAPALYVAWANSRYCLRPVLDTDDVAVPQPSAQRRIPSS